MSSTDNGKRKENKNQQKLSVSNRTTHDNQYPFLKEFSELLKDMSMADLIELMTLPEKNTAEGLWKAENYGGSRDKCKKRLVELYGHNWNKITSIKEHFFSIRKYYENSLILSHKKQWDDLRKSATMPEELIPE